MAEYIVTRSIALFRRIARMCMAACLRCELSFSVEKSINCQSAKASSESHSVFSMSVPFIGIGVSVTKEVTHG